MRSRRRPAGLVNRPAVIARACAVLPATIAPQMRAHSRCVAATRIGIAVLRRFGIVGEPLAVDVRAFNPAAVQWIEDGQPGGTPEFARRGCYYLTTRDEPGAVVRPPTRVNVGRTWFGHLVVHVPALRVIVDFDARQLARPEFNLHTLDAWTLPWSAAHGGAEARGEDGALVCYLPRVDDGAWRDAHDWQIADDDPLVGAVIAAMRGAR